MPRTQRHHVPEATGMEAEVWTRLLRPKAGSKGGRGGEVPESTCLLSVHQGCRWSKRDPTQFEVL